MHTLKVVSFKLFEKWGLFRVYLFLNFGYNCIEKLLSAAHENLMVSLDVILGCFGQNFWPFLFLAQNLMQLFLSFVVIPKICTFKKVLFLR